MSDGRPLAIDLYAGLGGWSEGLLAEGYRVVGFDIERHDYGDGKRYPAQLVLQDVRTIHGSQFKGAALIVASPPCQEYSYMAMPWSRGKLIAAEYRAGKRDVRKLTELFDACFRIQREAIEAAGHFIPLVVENVRGAQAWVGRARYNFGSFYLWGDVPALMPIKIRQQKSPVNSCKRLPGAGGGRISGWPHTETIEETGYKTEGMNWSDRSKHGQDFTRVAGMQRAGQKGIPHRPEGHWTNPAENGTKVGHDWFGTGDNVSPQRRASHGSKARKAASAMIAKIPFVLAQHIARCWKP